jgi:hypothetical protein
MEIKFGCANFKIQTSTCPTRTIRVLACALVDQIHRLPKLADPAVVREEWKVV